MDIPTKEIKNRSRQIARTLLVQAQRNEPVITENLQRIATEVSAELSGLENKFKSEQSLLRKIAENSFKNFKRLSESGISSKDAVDESITLTAQKIRDVLRYTFVFPAEKYVFGFKQSLQRLKFTENKISENKIWNAWKNIATPFDKGYRGINVTVISSQEQVFEIQFHTRASYDLKTETHFLYEGLRRLKTSYERRNEIIRQLVEAAGKVIIPKGVKKL